ncbi:MAG: ABC transporter permease [Actinomycetota bacterium]|nr:ABC transporter permease [Actinomycetota bacterium]
MSTTEDKEKNTVAPPNPLLTTPTTLIGSGHDGTVREQFNAWLQRIRGGEMGMLPALGGFVVLIILFSFLSPYFLTPVNMANLLTQTAALAMLAIALTFVILIAEIDLSAGVTGGVGMASFIIMVNKAHVNWVIALVIALAIGTFIGTFIGYFVAKVGVPSFVVTLGLFLGFQGLNLVLLGDGGLYRVETPEVTAIMNSNMPVWAGWVMAVVIILITFITSFYDRRRRQKVGVTVRPFPLLLGKTAAWGVFALVVVGLLSVDRSTSVIPIAGVPIVVPLALGVIWVGTVMLDRTRFGLHLYAVGGNPEAARRAGINVARVRIAAFMLCSTLAVVSGLFSASQTGTVESSAGTTIVLPGVAAAVVGGVSLFGGRGKLIQGAVGALVISSITNGLGLLGLPAGITFLVTGGVLVLAASVDAVSRRRSGSSSLARS